LKEISRTIVKTTILANAVYVVEKDGNKAIGNRPLEPVIVAGVVEKGKANKLFENQLSEGENLVIVDIQKEEKTFSLPVDKFIELAEKYESEKQA
jgi:hypothetical protein